MLLDGNKSDCSRFDFNKEGKKITTMIVRAHDQDNQMNVTIPSDLLGGKFSLMIDKASTEDFLVDNRQGYATISFSKFCLSGCGYQVEITGTKATESELLGYSYPQSTSSQPQLLMTNAQGEKIEQAQAGQQIVVFGNYQNLNQRAQPYIMLFAFLDEDGVFEYIDSVANRVAEPDSFNVAGISWMPEPRGDSIKCGCLSYLTLKAMSSCL